MMQIWDMDYDKEYVWIWEDEIKAIFNVDVQTGEVKLIKRFAHKALGSYRGIKIVGDNIYLAPQNGATELLIYNIMNDRIKRIKLKEEFLPKCGQHNLFISIEQKNDILYFIPGRYESIVCINTKSNNLTYIDGWFSEIEKIFSCSEEHFVIFNGTSRIDENRILISGWKSDMLMLFDMQDASYNVIYLNSSNGGLRGGIKLDDHYLISYKKVGGLYLSNNLGTDINKILDLQGRIFSFKNRIYVVSTKAAEIFRIETDGFNYSLVYSKPKMEANIENPFSIVKEYKNLIIAWNAITKEIVLFDMERESFITIDLTVIYKYDYKFAFEDGEGFLIEKDDEYNLEKYLKFMSFPAM